MMKTAEEAIKAIESHVHDPEVRIARRVEVGTVAIHQGDVYLTRVPDDHPRGALLGTRQVAVGNSVGARHVAEGDGVQVFEGRQYPKGFKEPEGVREQAMLGPVVVVPEVMTLTHPEHAHHEVRQPGAYQVTYQLDWKTMRAVQD